MLFRITDVDVLRDYPEVGGYDLSFYDIDTIYSSLVDKTEYPDIECWLYDMEKSGIIKEI